MAHHPLQKINMGGKVGTISVAVVDITSAQLRIDSAEQALHRKLSRGERCDLLIDNFPDWAHDYCRALVKAIHQRDIWFGKHVEVISEDGDDEFAKKVHTALKARLGE